MKLLGQDLDAEALVRAIQQRLEARGLADPPPEPIRVDGVEPRVDPMAFYLNGLEAHADPTSPLPLHTHRAGLGRAVLLAKWAFRKVARVAIVDTLARQQLFNAYVRDACLQLATEVAELREELERVRPPTRPPAPSPSARPPTR